MTPMKTATQRPDHWRVNCPIGCRFLDEASKSPCSDNGFPDMSHLREHLISHHGPRCSKRCTIVGNSEADWRQHRASCKLAKETYRLTQEQETMLNKLPRRSPRKTTIRQQWESIFAIIFPNEPFPALFVPSVDQVRQIANNPRPELVRLLAEQLQDSDLEAAHTKSGFVEQALQKLVPSLIDQLRRTGPYVALPALSPPASTTSSLDRSIMVNGDGAGKTSQTDEYADLPVQDDCVEVGYFEEEFAFRKLHAFMHESPEIMEQW